MSYTGARLKTHSPMSVCSLPRGPGTSVSPLEMPEMVQLRDGVRTAFPLAKGILHAVKHGFRSGILSNLLHKHRRLLCS